MILRKIKLRRMQIMVGPLVGQPFDRVFDVDKAGNLVPTDDYDFVNLDNEWEKTRDGEGDNYLLKRNGLTVYNVPESEESDEEEEKDNRNLNDHNTAQKLTNEEILALKEGLSSISIETN
jgi:hypothetical protein